MFQICNLYFLVVNKVGNGKFWVDETDQRSNLLFISIDKAIVGAPAMVTRLEEVRIIYNDSLPLSFYLYCAVKKGITCSR